jgi:hypothetical protein
LACAKGIIIRSGCITLDPLFSALPAPPSSY